MGNLNYKENCTCALFPGTISSSGLPGFYGKNGRNFVKAIMDRAKSEKKLTVVNDQVGSPTYTVDLAGAVRTLIEGGHAGIFNVTNRGKCSWYEFARKILECAGLKDVEIEPIAR